MIFCEQGVRWFTRVGVYLLLMACLGSALGCAMTDSLDSEPSITDRHTLDLVNTEMVQLVDKMQTESASRKFVQIKIAEAVNPKKTPVSFNVYYQDIEGNKNLLGTFSLFPPDNPGTFIVATQSKLQTGGKVIVAMMPLEQVTQDDEVRVVLESIAFVDE